MMNKSPSYLIDNQRLQQYFGLHELLQSAALSLFYAYVNALPDKQDWHGRYSWGHSDINLFGTSSLDRARITIEIDSSGIEYGASFCFRGESTYMNLYLSLDALTDPDFLVRAAAEWAVEKNRRIVEKVEAETKAEIDRNRLQRTLYEELKMKYEGDSAHDTQSNLRII